MENYSRYYQIIGHNIALYRRKKGADAGRAGIKGEYFPVRQFRFEGVFFADGKYPAKGNGTP